MTERFSMRKFDNYDSALETLKLAPNQDLENEFVQSGIIDKFALQFEFGWKLLKALLSYEGDATAVTGSPRDIIKAAVCYYDFLDEDTWLSMLRDRNNTAHVYDQQLAKQLVDLTISRYIPEFVRLRDGVVGRYGELLERLR